MVKSECIIASSRSYTNKKDGQVYDRDHQFRMITDCFHDNNHTLVTRCQRPEEEALADRVPVTSQLTGLTYWNRPCALCNADADFLVDWTPNVWVKMNLPYFSKSRLINVYPYTYELLLQLLSRRTITDIIYTPPEDISTKDQACIRDDSFRMRYCSNVLPNDDWLYEACIQFYNPAKDSRGDIFKNIFCLECHSSLQLKTDNPSCRYGEGAKANPRDFTGLLNYKLEPEATTEQEMVEQKCDCAQMYDPYLVSPLLDPLLEKICNMFD